MAISKLWVASSNASLDMQNEAKFADFDYDWEVHPAYRWALQPDSLQDVFDNLRPSTE